MSRKALGRGISALLREVETTPTGGLDEIPLDLIDPNPFQPRRAFPDAALAELANSIRASGLVQPVLVRRVESRYQLIAGERRARAARLAGLKTVPALVRALGDLETLGSALTENLLREDLNPLDAARGYQVLQGKFGLSHEQIAERLGLDRSTVTNTLRLLRLPPEIQAMIEKGDITAGHARAILKLDDPKEQLKLAKDIVKHGFSVRRAEDSAARKAGSPHPAAESKLDANTRAAILELERTLGTRVRLVGSPTSGKLEIRYYSGQDLQRIYEWIVKR